MAEGVWGPLVVSEKTHKGPRTLPCAGGWPYNPDCMHSPPGSPSGHADWDTFIREQLDELVAEGYEIEQEREQEQTGDACGLLVAHVIGQIRCHHKNVIKWIPRVRVMLDDSDYIARVVGKSAE